MIIRHVLANDPRFKGNRVEFKTGLNVVLADRHHAAGDQDTTNGAGKTTLLEIMQYCLGKDVSKDKRSIFHEPELLGWEFSLVISDEGRDVTFTRPVGPRSQITVESSDQVTGFPELGPNGKVTLSRNAFADSAGSFFFGLLPEFSGKYSPRFRSLISYFIRVGKEAYNRPFVHHRKQSEWDEQVSTTYLLRLNSDLASRWQVLRDREQRLKLLKQLA
ncbi:AAA family ATPase, partial [Symbiobacterium terraclitae]|uniref:AAA family ATPase n=1 Tax=Symbiobacterium terraclitae TaxID=557451 RepID=UPI0035B50405